MADVTDAAFRSIIAKYGKPDIFFTEFTSADGLCNSKGRKALMINLKFSPKERPIVAQLFSANPEKMREAAKLVAKLGFDGLDINLGCPDRSIEKSGAGAALIKNPKLAREIIRSAIEGVKGKIPISVKTRLGYNKDELETWLPELLAEDVVAVTIHARTRKEMSLVPARWERIKEAVRIRNNLKSKVLILGNGDVWNVADAYKNIKETGADGAMLGRAIFGNPWLFANLARAKHESQIEHSEQSDELTIKSRLFVMSEHAKLFEKTFGKQKNFSIMKKHFKAYSNGFDGAKELRIKLMETNNSKEVEKNVKEFLK